jgi:regulator of protease activity HflC (stomatin/prohibitin superfamily)
MSQERVVKVLSGWVMLPVTIALLAGGTALFVYSLAAGEAGSNGKTQPILWMLISGMLLWTLSFLTMPGFFTLQPNEARVLILFGAYKGTVHQGGFLWGNPFYANGSSQSRSAVARLAAQQLAGKKKGEGGQGGQGGGLGRYKISLRARTLNGEKLKVNDSRGNPIEIAAVVVWRVSNTAQAVFDVDDYEAYVTMQSETAVRHLASAYAYDRGEDETAEVTLRGNVDEVSRALREELGERLAKAGVMVDEARLTHLAYAPEIAQAMLRRQQAEAVIAARSKIVQGAVSMVDMALRQLAEKRVVDLDEERRAAMVSNLMVVLCGESEVHPVVNTGTLYA